jgi:stearoyl-CoA desaturase (delta-9 desaturase)
MNAIRHGGATVRVKRIENTILIGVPLLGTIGSLIYFHDHWPARVAVIQAVVWYVITGIGIGVGFHRLFSHRSFETFKLIRVVFGIAGSFAFQGSVVRWVSDHRRHHRFTDEEPDTHTPHRHDGPKFREKLGDLFHAHVGWMFDGTTTDPEVYAPDLKKDSVAQALTNWYWPLTGLSLALPTFIGWLVAGKTGAIDSLFLAGFVRTTALHNMIWAVNSVGHCWGSSPSTHDNESKNNFILALLTFGEGWHNNHHAAPRCAYNNWRGYEIDMNGFVIRTLKSARIIWAVNERPKSSFGPVQKDALVE